MAHSDKAIIVITVHVAQAHATERRCHQDHPQIQFPLSRPNQSHHQRHYHTRTHHVFPSCRIFFQILRHVECANSVLDGILVLFALSMGQHFLPALRPARLPPLLVGCLFVN